MVSVCSRRRRNEATGRLEGSEDPKDIWGKVPRVGLGRKTVYKQCKYITNAPN